MKLPLTYYGNPILRQKTQPITKITDEIRQLVADMQETTEHEDGVGLAAPQVGKSISLFITLVPKMEDDKIVEPAKLRVFINPKVLSISEETWTCQEGCLSIPQFWDDVERPLKVTIQAMDLDGNIFEEEFTEFDAHVILHENDHLNGVLFVDRLHAKRKKEIENMLRNIKKEYTKA